MNWILRLASRALEPGERVVLVKFCKIVLGKLIL